MTTFDTIQKQLAAEQEKTHQLRAALLAMQEAFSLANDYENDIPTAAANRVTARKLTREALQDTSEQGSE